MTRRLLLVVVCVLALPAAAAAAPVATTTTTTSSATSSATTASSPATTPPGIAQAPDDLDDLNTNTAGQQVPNEACGTAGLSTLAATNCSMSGNPESASPAGNYGLDVNTNTGVTDPGGDAASILQNILSWTFTGIASLISVLFRGLALVFSFDLFQRGLPSIAAALNASWDGFTVPLLPLALLIGGLIGLRHLARGDMGRTFGHFAAMFAVIVAGGVMILDPAGTLGWIDNLANTGAQGALSAFSGQGGGTTGAYADATPQLWDTMVTQPWCALEFGDVNGFCEAPVTPRMAQARASTLANLAAAENGSSGGGACVVDGSTGGQSVSCPPAGVPAALQTSIRRQLDAASTNGALFLAFPPDWDARNGSETWSLYYALGPRYSAIRQAGGTGERLVNLFLIGLGLVFFTLLVLFICFRLMIAALFFVVLLLFAPVMIFAPVLGDRGRAAFTQWFGRLVAALALKLVFAVYLGVLIGVSSLLASVAQTAGLGWLDEWILFGALWAAAWHFREKLPLLAHTSERVSIPALAAAGVLASRLRPQRSAGRPALPAADRQRQDPPAGDSKPEPSGRRPFGPEIAPTLREWGASPDLP